MGWFGFRGWVSLGWFGVWVGFGLNWVIEIEFVKGDEFSEGTRG